MSGIDKTNFRKLAQSAIEAYTKKEMLLDALMWATIVGLYESRIAELESGAKKSKRSKKSATGAVSLGWVLNQLAGMKFPGQGQAYDFIRRCAVDADVQDAGEWRCACPVAASRNGPEVKACGLCGALRPNERGGAGQ